jgi:hypothetical protein
MPLVRIKLSLKFGRPVKLRRNFADLSTPLNCLVEPIHGQGKSMPKHQKGELPKRV